jgi:hypothetical protein
MKVYLEDVHGIFLKIHRRCFAIGSGIHNIYVSFDSSKLYLSTVFYSFLDGNFLYFIFLKKLVAEF